MADNQVDVDVVIKTESAEKSLNKLAKTAENTLGEIKAAKPALNLVAFNQGLELAKKAFEFAKRAIEIPLEIAINAEKTKSIENQFNLLAAQAGQVGTSLRESLEKSADGLIDTTDLLESANKAFINLGTNASKLPEVLEATRKATLAFGGDLASNFDKVNEAIASGNIKSLRALGLAFDKAKAEREYARTLGVTAEALTQAGKQQAYLNAILQKSETSFKNINDNSLQITNELTRLKVVVADLGESFGKAFIEILGPAIKATIQSLRGLAQITKDVFDFTFRTGDAKQQIEQLTTEIQRMQKELFRINSDGALRILNAGESERLNLALTQKIELLKKLREEQAKKPEKPEGEAETDPAKVEADNLALQQIIQQTVNERINAENALAQAQGNGTKILQLNQEQQIATIEAATVQKNKIISDFHAKGIEDESAYGLALENINKTTAAKIALLNEQANAQQNAIKKQITGSFVPAIANSFSALGDALAKGANGFEAFGKSVLRSLGQLAVQIGTTLIGIGIGFSALGPIQPVWGLSGANAVIAGAALVTLGSAISAVGGGGGETSASTGGTVYSSSGSDSISQQQDVIAADTKPETKINVNVEGNVFNQRESGLEIARIIQEQFDLNGSVIAQGATV